MTKITLLSLLRSQFAYKLLTTFEKYNADTQGRI